eukprot:3638468-Rhodomonas_salina.1
MHTRNTRWRDSTHSTQCREQFELEPRDCFSIARAPACAAVASACVHPTPRAAAQPTASLASPSLSSNILQASAEGLDTEPRV